MLSKEPGSYKHKLRRVRQKQVQLANACTCLKNNTVNSTAKMWRRNIWEDGWLKRAPRKKPDAREGPSASSHSTTCNTKQNEHRNEGLKSIILSEVGVDVASKYMRRAASASF
jgi:hypothetical protein